MAEIRDAYQAKAAGGVWIVDRATDRGQTVGPGEWDLKLLEEEGAWVNFRGHWGRSVLYPPESGPSGPHYYQDGSVRKAWRDPIGWADLPR